MCKVDLEGCTWYQSRQLAYQAHGGYEQVREYIKWYLIENTWADVSRGTLPLWLDDKYILSAGCLILGKIMIHFNTDQNICASDNF